MSTQDLNPVQFDDSYLLPPYHFGANGERMAAPEPPPDAELKDYLSKFFEGELW